MDHTTSTINIITERRSNGEYLGLHTAPKTHFHFSTSPQNPPPLDVRGSIVWTP